MFDVDGFMRFLSENFNGFENAFLRETVENIIVFALAHMDYSKNQMVYFLADILPEVAPNEIAAFFEKEGRQQK